MKLRVVALAIVVVALFSGSAFAQPMLTYGVKGGVGFADLSLEEDDEDEFFGMRTGFLIGGAVDVPVNNMFSTVIEFLYTQKGAKGEEGGFEQTIKIDYIEIPILANFPFNSTNNVRPFAYGGISPAFQVSAKSTFEGPGVDEEEDIEEISGFDMGLIFGGGVRFGQMGVEGRYDLGLMNILDTEFEEDSVKNKQFSILFSYYF